MLRLALIVLGLAAVIYGTSTLTGGWLGTPPWWEEERHAADVTVFGSTHRMALVQDRPGREWISGAVITVGVGLTASGTWPRRRRSASAAGPDPT